MTTSSQTPGRDAMRRLFDELVERGARLIRRRAVQRALAEGMRRAWWLLPVVPATVLLIQGARALAGAPEWAPHWIPLLIVTLAVPAIPLVRGVLRARKAPVDRRGALGLFDGAAEAEERLVTADELIAASGESGFVEAALQDAGDYLGRARTARPVLSEQSPQREPLAFVSAGITILLLLGVMALGGNPFLISTEHDLVPQPLESAARPRTEPDEQSAVPRPTADDIRRPEEAPAQMASPEADERAAAAPDRLPEDARKKEGRTGSGRSSQAQASRGEGEARGSPTNQGQTTKKPQSKRKMGPPKKKPKTARTPPPPSEKTSGEESGSTTGRGSSRGSNKNPVTSDWKSKDQVTTEEDEEVEDDEEIEDEEVDSEARGGMQPTLRDRKPPVSRDLTIGFGNRPNPNANGRGGPSQPKKSRGTASLVLGVPIPDRVKGRANPGKTKVTQERVEPRPESAPQAQAEARTPRAGPSGPLARPHVSPWMQGLIRDYFLRLHNQEKAPR